MDAYPPLENTTSGMYQKISQSDCKIPKGILKTSTMFRKLKYLLTLPVRTDLNFSPLSVQAFLIKSPSPMTINSKGMLFAAAFFFKGSTTETRGNKAPATATAKKQYSISHTLI